MNSSQQQGIECSADIPFRIPLGSFVGWAMALLCLVVAPFQIAAQEVGLQLITLHVGFTRASFRIVNASDATSAFRVFAQTAGRKRGYALDTDAQVFDNSAACEAEIKKGTINMAILDSWDFLGMDIHQVMEPVFVSVEQGSFLKEYLLLVRRDSGLTRLADLRGKELMVLEGKGGQSVARLAGQIAAGAASWRQRDLFFQPGVGI